MKNGLLPVVNALIERGWVTQQSLEEAIRQQVLRHVGADEIISPEHARTLRINFESEEKRDRQLVHASRRRCATTPTALRHAGTTALQTHRSGRPRLEPQHALADG